MSIRVDVADAVTAELNATEFSVAFIAETTSGRRNRTIKELEVLTVEVVPVSLRIDLADRGHPGEEVTIDIFLRQKMGLAAQELQSGEIAKEEIEHLTDLAEEIAFHFMPPTADGGTLAGYTNGSWQSCQIVSGYADDRFTKTRIFLGQIRLVFQIYA